MNQFEKFTGGLPIGAAVGLYAFAVFLLATLDEALHSKAVGSGGIWWTALPLALVLWIAFSFGRFKAEQEHTSNQRSGAQKVTTRRVGDNPEKASKEFNLPL